MRHDALGIAGWEPLWFQVASTGTCAKEKQDSLAPIQMGWKRWVEIHSNKGRNESMTPRTEWTWNLQISGSIETNMDAIAVSWNIGPHGYKGSKEAVHQIFEQEPPVICLQDVRMPKRGKQNIIRELHASASSPTTGYIKPYPSAREPMSETAHICSVPISVPSIPHFSLRSHKCGAATRDEQSLRFGWKWTADFQFS